MLHLRLSDDGEDPFLFFKSLEISNLRNISFSFILVRQLPMDWVGNGMFPRVIQADEGEGLPVGENTCHVGDRCFLGICGGGLSGS